MGAANAIAAYRAWSHLGDRALRVLAYMALVARDGDAEPWFGLGHEALSEQALGHPLNGNEKDREAALRAVRRAITELHQAGAITTAKRPTNQGRRVHYRLWIDGPSPDAQRPTIPAPVDNPGPKPVENSPSPDAQRPTTPPVVGRKFDGHRTNSGQSPDENRPTHIEEEEEPRGAKTSNGSLSEANCGKRARDPPMSLTA